MRCQNDHAMLCATRRPTANRRGPEAVFSSHQPRGHFSVPSGPESALEVALTAIAPSGQNSSLRVRQMQTRSSATAPAAFVMLPSNSQTDAALHRLYG